MAPTGFDHSAIVMTFGAILTTFVKTHHLGIVVGGEAGFVLARNPDVVRAVDIGFVAASRIPASGRPVKYWEGCPDLAVEVISPNDKLEEVEEKVDDYLNAGTRLVWVLNPRRRTVTVYRSGRNPVVLRANDTLEGEDVLPNFQCVVAEIFA
jgi:Uma2 family endonuclease